jgi:site-specific DNA recombinase
LFLDRASDIISTDCTDFTSTEDTMIAAVYARKSTQQEGAGATSESVERQIQHAQQFITKKGWAIGPVYYDDAISGVTYAKLKDRARMVTDAAAGKFQALVVSEQSRLGRDWIESAYTIKKICDSGVRIFAYLRDEEIEVTTDSGKMRIVFTGYASSQESTRTSERTRDGLRKRASAGYVTGGRLYGYKDSKKFNADGQCTHTLRAIDPQQAKVVRRIFTLFADGKGIHSIADTLNRDGIPGPRDSWTQGGVRAMLTNEHYIGQVIFGKRVAVIREGRETLRHADPSEWVRQDRPDLRIIPAALWKRVDVRRRQGTAPFARQTRECKDGRRRGGLLIGRPAGSDHSEYLLTGFSTCAKCSGSIRISNRQHGQNPKNRRRVYVCSAHETRGKAICQNNTVVPQAVLDEIVVQAISGVLDQRILDAAVERAFKRIKGRERQQPDRRTEIERDLAEITKQQRAYLRAIAGGKPPKALVAELTALEARQVALEAEMGNLKKIVPIDEGKIRAQLRESVRDVKTLLASTPIRARQTLRRLLVDKITCTPFVENGKKGFRFSGTLAVGRLLGDSLTRLAVVRGAGC